ncbi:MAG: histidinol-phosphatase [Bacteroidales bacterium]
MSTFAGNYSMLTNFHSHTFYSDGSSKPVDYVHSAIERGMTAYGFSCHAPIPFAQNWCMRPENLEKYFATISDLKEEFKDRIELYAGLEIDYIPGHSSVNHFKNLGRKLNYTIGSVHYVDYFPDGTPCNIDGRPDEFRRGLSQIWKEDIIVAVKRYFHLVREMLITSPPDIVAHIDKIRMHNRDNCQFDPEEKWYMEEMANTLEILQQSGSLMEINTRGVYKGGFSEPYPSEAFIREAFRHGIGIIMNSDAHKPEEITSGFEETSKLLKRCGYREQVVLLQNTWQTIPL